MHGTGARAPPLAGRPDRSSPRHGLGSRRELHPAPTHPPAAGARAPRTHGGLPRPPAGPPGLHPAPASAARAAGEPRPCPRPSLRCLAARGGLVCRSYQDASREEVQQRLVWRGVTFLGGPGLGVQSTACSDPWGRRLECGDSSFRFSGLIGSVFSFLQFLSAPLTGAASDCLGRRPVMLLSLVGLATSYAVWATSRSFAAFLASRVIGGISKGNVSLSTAIVADLGSPPARSRGMAVIGVAFSLGFTLGPMLGASLPMDMVPWLALIFAISDLLFILCFLPETLPLEKRAPRQASPVPRPLPQAPSMALGFVAATDLLSPLALFQFSATAHGRDPPAGDSLCGLRRLGLAYFVYLFLFSGLEYTLSFLTHQRFQFSSLQQGKMFFFIGLTMATIQGIYTRRIGPGREIAAVKRAILLLVPAFLLVGWGRTLPVLGFGLLFYSFAAAVVVPCLSSVVAGYGSPGQKGTVMGTLRSLGALARAVGPMVAASVYWLAGARVCFTVCSGLFLLPFLLLRNLRPPAQTPKAE
ncbi:major facilitator superfamily domain-containing protein 10 isoform X5 [Manis javanica]|uniref:major facilitator superfamily domain-containing protein 10 isoform X5 n=1 Tax=Manis javanica TaxID=9974 RepID=UPI003C6DA29B